jgi:ADP-ribose pyrophosphatase YjhB (NUDIX family)
VAAVAILSREDRNFLLVKRGEDPGKGRWGLPGGFVELGETIEMALVRELAEETGYQVELGDLVGVWSYYNEYRRLSGAAIIYSVGITSGELVLSSDVTDAKWVTFEELDRFDLAFKSHREALVRWAGSQ